MTTNGYSPAKAAARAAKRRQATEGKRIAALMLQAPR
jgi:hypothetical protein